MAHHEDADWGCESAASYSCRCPRSVGSAALRGPGGNEAGCQCWSALKRRQWGGASGCGAAWNLLCDLDAGGYRPARVQHGDVSRS